MYFGGIPKMTTLKKLLQNMKSVMQTRSFRQILMLCLMLIGLLVVYFIYVRKYNVNKREGAAGGRPETEKEMNEKVDKYLELLNACTNLDPNSGEYTNRLDQQIELAKKIKAGFEQKIDTIKGLKKDKKTLKGKIISLEGRKNNLKDQNDKLNQEMAAIVEENHNIQTNEAQRKAVQNGILTEVSENVGKALAEISEEQPIVSA